MQAFTTGSLRPACIPSAVPNPCRQKTLTPANRAAQQGGRLRHSNRLAAALDLRQENMAHMQTGTRTRQKA
jgi:hypothetical protein